MKKHFWKIAIAVIAILFAADKSEAQTDYFDFTFDKEAIKDRNVLPYRPLREADAVYAKRVERVIDTRERKNLVMKWPKSALNRILYEMAMNAEINAYRNDSLRSTFDVEELETIGGFCEVIEHYPDPDDPYYFEYVEVCTDFDYNQIQKFRIMEDWVFDKQSGIFYSRIIAIAPIYKPEIQGIELPEQPMFWMRWDEVRQKLVNYEIFNRHNEAARLSYYDFFEQRLFSSYIVREPNEFDYSINQFEHFQNDPFAALLKSEEIREQLFNFEHDLWNY